MQKSVDNVKSCDRIHNVDAVIVNSQCKGTIMQTDYQLTGKTYKALEAFTRGNCSQEMPNPAHWYYFGTTQQFKTCTNFVKFLEARHPGHKFRANIVK